MPEAAARNGPAPAIRLLGRTVNAAVPRFPRSWRLARGPVRRFFDRVAPRWDERVRIDAPEYRAPLSAAFGRLEPRPSRALDIGRPRRRPIPAGPK
jgi:hypothetical protein